ncbi:cupin domain-containing protein [Streptomyces echinatus]|uniref:cupin domain-containing protein n=1 Tax=Streptomyces echinatus TaxID=67293 RepID=UPI0037A41E33
MRRSVRIDLTAADLLGKPALVATGHAIALIPGPLSGALRTDVRTVGLVDPPTGASARSRHPAPPTPARRPCSNNSPPPSSRSVRPVRADGRAASHPGRTDETRHGRAAAEEAERVPLPHGGGFVLLADGSDTGGALGANRLALGRGTTGARTHYHARSTELFHVLGGTMWFTVAGTTTTIAVGGLVCVPPGTPHSFGAAADSTADLLAILPPGVDRFDYFRALGRVRSGREPFDRLLPEQDRYDVHFLPEPGPTAE